MEGGLIWCALCELYNHKWRLFCEQSTKKGILSHNCHIRNPIEPIGPPSEKMRYHLQPPIDAAAGEAEPQTPNRTPTKTTHQRGEVGGGAEHKGVLRTFFANSIMRCTLLMIGHGAEYGVVGYIGIVCMVWTIVNGV